MEGTHRQVRIYGDEPSYHSYPAKIVRLNHLKDLALLEVNAVVNVTPIDLGVLSDGRQYVESKGYVGNYLKPLRYQSKPKFKAMREGDHYIMLFEGEGIMGYSGAAIIGENRKLLGIQSGRSTVDGVKYIVSPRIDEIKEFLE